MKFQMMVNLISYLTFIFLVLSFVARKVWAQKNQNNWYSHQCGIHAGVNDARKKRSSVEKYLEVNNVDIAGNATVVSDSIEADEHVILKSILEEDPAEQEKSNFRTKRQTANRYGL